MLLLLAHFLMRECGLAVQKGREEEPDLPRFAEYRGSWLTVSQILSTRDQTGGDADAAPERRAGKREVLL